MGLQPTFYLEGKLHGEYILAHQPDARIAVLVTNDDTKEAVRGLRDGLGGQSEKLIVKELTYEVTDPTIDSQIVALKASGANVFYDVTAPRSAAQAIRKSAEIGWKPLHFSFLYFAVDPSGVAARRAGKLNWHYFRSVCEGPTGSSLEG
jgi:branched-chain amino acid transport system substrate-binding protein